MFGGACVSFARFDSYPIISPNRNPGNYSANKQKQKQSTHLMLSSHLNDLFLVDRSMSKLHFPVG